MYRIINSRWTSHKTIEFIIYIRNNNIRARNKKNQNQLPSNKMIPLLHIIRIRVYQLYFNRRLLQQCHQR